MKAYFRGSGESVEVECPFDGEALYCLWIMARKGAEVRVPIKIDDVAVFVDIKTLDVNMTLMSLMETPQVHPEEEESLRESVPETVKST